MLKGLVSKLKEKMTHHFKSPKEDDEFNPVLHASNASIWSMYDPDLKKEQDWFPLSYSYNNIKFVDRSIANPGDPYFEKVGHYLYLHRKPEEFFAIVGEPTVEVSAVISKRREMLRVGDVLFNGKMVMSLKVYKKELYINGEKFSDLKEQFFKNQKA